MTFDENQIRQGTTLGGKSRISASDQVERWEAAAYTRCPKK